MKGKKNTVQVVLLVISILLALVSVTYAAYTSLSSVKRVVTVKGTQQLFTSSILLAYAEEQELQTRIISFSESDEKLIFEIDVANYMQGDLTKFDIYGINYDLQIEVIDVAGNRVTDSTVYSSYLIDDVSMGENPYKTTGKLSGGSPSKKTYKVEIPMEYMSLYRLKVTAVPKDSRYMAIGRIIATSTERFTPHWTGKFLENEKAAVIGNEDLGIINYQISGHIEENCTLTWDSSKMEVDPWFLSDLGIGDSDITTQGNRKSVVLHLGSEGTPDQYIIKFYRTYAVQDVDENWNIISDTENGYITFKNSVTEE